MTVGELLLELMKGTDWCMEIEVLHNNFENLDEVNTEPVKAVRVVDGRFQLDATQKGWTPPK